MKRFLICLLLLTLLLPLACKSKPEPEPEPVPAVTAPAESEVSLRLPFGARNDVAKSIPAYTAGFSTTDQSALTYSVLSADPLVAEGVLRDDGTLYVIAHGVGETKLTVTAATASGEKGSSVVSVKVTDARRTVALIVLGVLAVALFVLLGKPAAKKPEPTAEESKESVSDEESETPTVIFEEPQKPAAPDEPETPTVIFEEPKNDPERS